MKQKANKYFSQNTLFLIFFNIFTTNNIKKIR
jgi:hypothetical protein